MDRGEMQNRREESHKNLRNQELLRGFSYDDGKNVVALIWP